MEKNEVLAKKFLGGLKEKGFALGWEEDKLRLVKNGRKQAELGEESLEMTFRQWLLVSGVEQTNDLVANILPIIRAMTKPGLVRWHEDK